VADLLRRGTREGDVLARFGGDEFLVVLPGLHFAGAVAIAERLFRELRERPLAVDGLPVPPVALSAGVALFPSRDVRTRDSLLRSADVALGVAKREGGGRVCVYQQEGQIYTPFVGADHDAGERKGSV
jgi:diguanylate cyclase (GGDEF)-like protein